MKSWLSQNSHAAQWRRRRARARTLAIGSAFGAHSRSNEHRPPGGPNARQLRPGNSQSGV